MYGRQLSVLVVVLMIFSTFLHGDNNYPLLVKVDAQMREDIVTADLTVHPEIVIGSNSDFENQGWPGNGSASDPYQI